MVIDYLYSGKGRNLTKAFHERTKETESKIHIDYALHAVISEGTQEELSQISNLIDLGIINFKVFKFPIFKNI